MAEPTRRRTAPARSARTRAPRVRLVLSSAPPALAPRLARRLVREGVAACVSVVPDVRSVYRWKGAVEEAREALLIIKTTATALPRCLAALTATHPYEVPEGLVLRPTEALAAYARWLEGSVRSLSVRMPQEPRSGRVKTRGIPAESGGRGGR